MRPLRIGICSVEKYSGLNEFDVRFLRLCSWLAYDLNGESKTAVWGRGISGYSGGRYAGPSLSHEVEQ